jgi:hypothetical protein
MNRADLRGSIEGAHRFGQGDLRVGAVARCGGNAESLRDERLRGRPSRLEDRVPALGLSDALQS